jgi:uncharacterized protein YybS (DUF2232 family)
MWLLSLAVLLLLYVGSQINSLVFLLAGILAPLPVLIVGYGRGPRGALLLALAAALAVFSLKPGWETVWANLGFGSLLLLGVILSVIQHRGIPPPRAIFFAVAALSVAALLILLGQAVLTGVSPMVVLAQRSSEIMAMARQVLGAAAGEGQPLVPGVPQESLEAWVRRLLPGLVITNTGLVAWLNVVLARQFAFVMGWRKPEPPLYQWTAPEWLIFVALGSGFLLLIPVGAVRFASLNLLMVLALLYFCQGVAVVAAWFQRLALPRLMRLVGYPLLFLNPVFFLIITLGLMDLWLDFRRLHQPRDA